MEYKIVRSIVNLTAVEGWGSYRVALDYQGIHVTVTYNPDIVRCWISTVTFAGYNVRPNRFVVGVRCGYMHHRHRIQRSLYRQVNALQLCVGEHCLIFRLRRATGNVPQELLDFLGDDRFTFVGFGIHNFALSLFIDYGINFGTRTVDLNVLYEIRRLRNVEWSGHNYGIPVLVNLVLQKDYETPMDIIRSNWDSSELQDSQILHACTDTYCCYMIGVRLRAWDFRNV